MENMHLPLVAVAIYLLVCFGGQYLMRSRTPFDLTWQLKWWNGALAAFSICGMLRTVPHLLVVWHEKGLYSTMCEPSRAKYGFGPSGLWTVLFILSKLPELGDTVFIVLRKK